MNRGMRMVIRWLHILLGIPIMGYIYSPFDKIPQYAPATRYVFFPAIVMLGLFLWKGHLVLGLFRKNPSR